ncbi:MAG: hypothetical protein FWC00_03665 [Firmicutes bacterium]|nr:hypothetical protein [Bacillota bacterium]
MAMLKKKKAKAARIFDTISDIGSLFMATIYILYVVLLLIFDVGVLWLNWSMFGITILYIIFFVVKMSTLNKLAEAKIIKRRTLFAFRYSKWAMKIVNAVFVIIAVATTQHTAGNVFLMIGVFVVGFSFLISVMWDVTWFVLRRKFRDIWQGWENLSPEEKGDRINMLIDRLLQSIDNIAGVDVKQEVVLSRLKKGKEINGHEDDDHESQESQTQ